jgi:hypothetical protein
MLVYWESGKIANYVFHAVYAGFSAPMLVYSHGMICLNGLGPSTHEVLASYLFFEIIFSALEF